MGLPDFGKYAFYVWTSYGIAAFVMIINLVLPMLKRKEILKTLNRKLRREQSKS
ncbi:MAG: heme exporter protein CcmD [Gammaproteobacteria bacterium]|nr:heme exporter protein CcmD [Gammaproteobacteria bacterium]MDH5652319.1 heme exporter protein CcmD [Gammaproteobacteria bacterium]